MQSSMRALELLGTREDYVAEFQRLVALEMALMESELKRQLRAMVIMSRLPR